MFGLIILVVLIAIWRGHLFLHHSVQVNLGLLREQGKVVLVEMLGTSGKRLQAAF